jgi:hypothetical protein
VIKSAAAAATRGLCLLAQRAIRVRIGHPALDVVDQSPGREVSVLDLHRHRLQADGFEAPVNRGTDRSRPGEVAVPDRSEDREDISPFERSLADQEAIKSRSQTVDVGRGTEAFEVALGLLGAHVSGSADRVAVLGLGASAGRGRDQGPFVGCQIGRGLAHRLGQAPVDDQGLAILTDDHVTGLDVAVENPSTVGVVDRVADVDEPPEELAEGKRPLAWIALEFWVAMEALDRFLERIAPDEPHGVVRPAVVVVPESINRNDPGMLQAAGDLGLDQESGPAHLVVGVVVEDLLERDLAVQLGVESHEDSAQAALSVGPEDSKPLAIAGRNPERHRGRRILGRRVRTDEGDALGEIRVAEGRELLDGRQPRGHRGERSLGVAIVELQLLRGHRNEQGAALLVDHSSIDQDHS